MGILFCSQKENLLILALNILNFGYAPVCCLLLLGLIDYKLDRFAVFVSFIIVSIIGLIEFYFKYIKRVGYSLLPFKLISLWQSGFILITFSIILISFQIIKYIFNKLSTKFKIYQKFNKLKCCQNEKLTQKVDSPKRSINKLCRLNHNKMDKEFQKFEETLKLEIRPISSGDFDNIKKSNSSYDNIGK